MKCAKCDNERVEVTILSKTSYYCRTCKDDYWPKIHSKETLFYATQPLLDPYPQQFYCTPPVLSPPVWLFKWDADKGLISVPVSPQDSLLPIPPLFPPVLPPVNTPDVTASIPAGCGTPQTGTVHYYINDTTATSGTIDTASVRLYPEDAYNFYTCSPIKLKIW